MSGRRDDGTIVLLTLGYLVVALSLVLVVVDVSAVYLARRGLVADCDSAALAAAQSVDPRTIYATTADRTRLPLGDVRTAVGRVDPSGALTASLRDDETVVVTGRRTVRLPVVGFLGIRPVTVVAHAAAQSVRRP